MIRQREFLGRNRHRVALVAVLAALSLAVVLDPQLRPLNAIEGRSGRIGAPRQTAAERRHPTRN